MVVKDRDKLDQPNSRERMRETLSRNQRMNPMNWIGLGAAAMLTLIVTASAQPSSGR